jgi:hypothetical protein
MILNTLQIILQGVFFAEDLRCEDYKAVQFAGVDILSWA